MSVALTGHPELVRVRFAPSPTGYLHIGGVRTALFNWLYARRHGGQFLLRIEDTDRERSGEEYTRAIFDSLKWLGLAWDEQAIYQSQRFGVYRDRAEELVRQGHAYRCYCTEEEIQKGRDELEARGKKPMYNRRCRDLNLPHRPPEEGAYTIRAKLPLEGAVEFEDLVKGITRVENAELDDFIIVRSNGVAMYNFAVVVDDSDSRITHVIRGDDHMNNTPKQVHLFKLMDKPLPKFAHIPLILGADKKKLSKRNGVVSTDAYRSEGYLPEALLNGLARLGWSHGDQEVFTIPELIEAFSFDSVQRSGAVFNSEKLLWLNGEHLRKQTPRRLIEIATSDFASLFSAASLERAKSPIGEQIAALLQPKVKTLKELAHQMIPLCTPGAIEVDLATVKWGKDPAAKPAIQTAIVEATTKFAERIKGAKPGDRAGANAVWGVSPSLADAGMSHTDVDAFLRQIAEAKGLKLGELAQPMRSAVTGGANAGLFDLLSLLPWDVIEPRLKKFS